MLEKGCDAHFFADTVTSEYYKNLGQVQFSLKNFIPMCQRNIDLEREKIRIFGIEETIDFQPTNIEKQGRIFHHKILRKILR